MIVQILVSLLADLVFESAARAGRSFDAEMNRYFEQKGFHSVTSKASVATRSHAAPSQA